MLPLLVGAAVSGAALVGGLAYVGYRLWQLDQWFVSLDQEFSQHRKDVRAAHEQHVKAINGRLVDIEESQNWAMPWVQFWAGSQAAQQELVRRRRTGQR